MLLISIRLVRSFLIPSVGLRWADVWFDFPSLSSVFLFLSFIPVLKCSLRHRILRLKKKMRRRSGKSVANKVGMSGSSSANLGSFACPHTRKHSLSFAVFWVIIWGNEKREQTIEGIITKWKGLYFLHQPQHSKEKPFNCCCCHRVINKEDDLDEEKEGDDDGTELPCKERGHEHCLHLTNTMGNNCDWELLNSSWLLNLNCWFHYCWTVICSLFALDVVWCKLSLQKRGPFKNLPPPQSNWLIRVFLLVCVFVRFGNLQFNYICKVLSSAFFNGTFASSTFSILLLTERERE